MQIFHVAETARWEAAKLAGSYARSTRGRTVEQEGFIHACRAEQIDEVRERHYADVTEPLVLLVIDTDRLTSPWSEDEVGTTTYPHIHGPLNLGAVVSVLPLGDATESATSAPAAAAPQPAAPATASPSQGSLMNAFLGEMAFRMMLAVVVMCLVLVFAFLTDAAGLQPLLGAVAGFAIGIPLAVLASRRRDERISTR